MQTSVLPCFKCGKKLEVDEQTSYIMGGLSFTSFGGYGSSVYDPPITGSNFLRIHICDECIIEAGETILEATRVPDDIIYRKWAADEPSGKQIS